MTEKLTKVYHDDKILSTYSMYDDKEIAIQIVPETTVQPNENQQLVMVKFWDPKSWTLGAPFELFIDKESTLSDFATTLSTLFPSLPPQEIQCTKINSPWNFHRVELPFV